MVTPGFFFWKSWFARSVRSARSLAPHQNMRSLTSLCANALSETPDPARPAIAAAEHSNARRVSSSFVMGLLLLSPILLRDQAGAWRRHRAPGAQFANHLGDARQ